MANEVPTPRQRPTRAEIFDTLLGFFSVACIVGGAVYGLTAGNWLAAIFLALVGIWVEVGS